MLQVEQIAEVQKQERAIAAADYERKLAKVSSELKYALDAAERYILLKRLPQASCVSIK